MKKALITYITQQEPILNTVIYGHAFLSGEAKDWEEFIKKSVDELERKENWKRDSLHITSFTKL